MRRACIRWMRATSPARTLPRCWGYRRVKCLKPWLRGAKTGYFVCCIPVDQEVDLKKAAKAVGDKKAEMLPMKDLLPVTGYLRGGCSPVGMKKKFPTFFDASAQKWERISVSAGTRGEMVLVGPERLRALTGAMYAELVL